MKLAIGDELQNLFHPIVNAIKQSPKEAVREFAPMKKALAYIDGALLAQRSTIKPPPISKPPLYWLNIYRFNWQLNMVKNVLYQIPLF